MGSLGKMGEQTGPLTIKFMKFNIGEGNASWQSGNEPNMPISIPAVASHGCQAAGRKGRQTRLSHLHAAFCRVHLRLPAQVLCTAELNLGFVTDDKITGELQVVSPRGVEKGGIGNHGAVSAGCWRGMPGRRSSRGCAVTGTGGGRCR